VALALLLTVLIPLSTFVLYLVVQQRNTEQIEALSLGERFMEETLYDRSYAPEERWTDAGRWRLEKTVRQEAERVVLTVRVFRRGRAAPHVTLATTRPLR
jgi:hypothetical protein